MSLLVAAPLPSLEPLIETVLKAVGPICASCEKRCGCIQCAAYLPCTCTDPNRCKLCGYVSCTCPPPLCKTCGLFPCSCKTGVTQNWFNNAINNGGIITANVTANANQILTNFGNMYNLPNQMIQSLNQVANVTAQYIQKNYLLLQPRGQLRIPLTDIITVVWQVCHEHWMYCTCDVCITCEHSVCICLKCLTAKPTTGLATGPGFYQPSMLQSGDDHQKIARLKAIELRNQILGRHVRDLYGPSGFHIKSKIYPERTYVVYAHHGSIQVYDRGVNVGRLDVHVEGYDIPFGDQHLAAILKIVHDEEDMLKTAFFSPVRDI